jgi:hypothetical protein
MNNWEVLTSFYVKLNILGIFHYSVTLVIFPPPVNPPPQIFEI